MNRLDCLDDALLALAVFLHAHGPACVCGPCTAYAQATALLPRLEHLLTILEHWSTAEWEEGEDEAGITQEDLQEALRVLDADNTTRPAAGAGEGAG